MSVSVPISRSLFFRHHWRWYESLRPLPFLLAISAEGVVAGILAGGLMSLLGASSGGNRAELSQPVGDVFVLTCLYAPIVETMVYQFLPITLLGS